MLERLTKKPASEKKVAITVFSFPPDKGNVGTAAYLNVFGSIFKVLQDLKADGYDIGELPEDETALMQKVQALYGFLHMCIPCMVSFLFRAHISIGCHPYHVS